MQIGSLPEQFFPNRPSEHWHCPSFPQVPWPLHVVLGIQNAGEMKGKYRIRALKSHGSYGNSAPFLQRSQYIILYFYVLRKTQNGKCATMVTKSTSKSDNY